MLLKNEEKFLRHEVKTYTNNGMLLNKKKIHVGKNHQFTDIEENESSS